MDGASRGMDGTTLWPVIRHALLYGAMLSAMMCALLVGLLWMNPEILLNDYPPDIREKHGPISARSKRHRALAALVIGAAALGVVAASLSEVRTGSGGKIHFLTAFIHLFVMFSVFNIVDLLVLDWPLVAIGPRFVILPGTEGSAGYKNYGFHFRGFLIGAALILIASGLMAAVVAAIF
jgi:hypothetical protein